MVSVDHFQGLLRERILENAREVEELSRLPLQPASFFRQFLKRTIAAIGARCGTVWLRDSEGKLTKCADLWMSEPDIADDPESFSKNQALLATILSSGEARCLPLDDDENPFAELLYLSPLHLGENCAGVVQILHGRDASPIARQGQLQFIEQMAGFASQFLNRTESQAAHSAIGKDFWADLSELTLRLQSSLDFKAVALTAVNDGRMLLNCDRLSIARTHGRKTVIEAISGQDQVNHRANLVRAMSRLASRVIPTGETVLFGGSSDKLPPQVKEPLAEFIAESGSRMVMLVPLHAAQQNNKTPDNDRGLQGEDERERPWGCLILEQVADAEPRPDLEQQAHALSDHVAAALTNARDHQRVFLLSFWKMLGRCREWFYGRKLLKTILAAALVSGVVAALMLIRWEYRVEGEGRLLPVMQREIFAPWDGVVVDVLVADGQRVEQGTLLLKIRDDKLDSQLADVRSLAKEKKQEQLSLEARIDDAIDESNREDAVRLQGKLVEVMIQLRGHETQARLLAKRQADLEVKSTIAGVVATFQVEQLLINRPVRQGELLLQVMDDRGDWMLELDVDEHRMGHLLTARERLGKKNLDIDFVLATAPETNYRGHLTKVVTRPMLLPDRGSVVRVFGAIDDREFEHRIGADVRAKIHCGEKSLGYVLFGDVIEFLYQRFWL